MPSLAQRDEIRKNIIIKVAQKRLRAFLSHFFTGASSDFYAKTHRKHLKVLFIVSELCDTMFTVEAPGTKQTHRRETP